MVNDNGTEPPVAASLANEARRPDVDACDVCCDAMPGYVCDDLNLIDKLWIDEHTARCGYCQHQLTGFQRLDHLLSEYQQDASAGVKAPAFGGRTRTVARYGTMDSPLGLLLIAVTDAGVAEITFGRTISIQEFLSHMVERGFDPVPDQQAIDPVVTQLAEYFQGSRNVSMCRSIFPDSPRSPETCCRRRRQFPSGE